MVGTTISAWTGVDRVTAGDIRRQLEVIGFDCPLHYDEIAARDHGHDTIVAPVSMSRIWAMPAYWSPGDAPLGTTPMSTPIAATKVPGEGDTMIATNVRMEYETPVHPGDLVSGTAILKSVTRKNTRLGPGAFLVVETTYANQHGDTVAVETVTLLRYQQQPKEAV